MKLPDDVITYD